MITVKEAGRKPYPAYKETDIPWLDELPEHWETVRVQDLGSGKAKSFTDGDWIESPYITSDGTRLIQTGNIGVGKFIEKGYRYVSNTTFEELHCTEVEPGDILICRLGEPVARACAAPDLGKRMITSVDVCIVKVRDDLNPQFAIYSMSSGSYLDWAGSTVRGSTRDRISRFMLGKFVLPLPPLDEQAAIVRCLDNADQRIRAYVSAKERLIALLEEERQAVIHQAVTRGLDPNVNLKPSGVEWLGDVPEHWQILRLDSLATKFGSGITPRGGASVYQETGIPFLRSQNIHFDGLRLTDVARISPSLHQELASSHVKPGDVLLNITGASIGRVSTVPPDFEDANVNQHVCIIRPKQDLLLSKLLSAYLSTQMMQQEIQSAQSGASREGLTLQSIRDFNVIIPPIIEQQAMVKSLRKRDGQNLRRHGPRPTPDTTDGGIPHPVDCRRGDREDRCESKLNLGQRLLTNPSEKREAIAMDLGPDQGPDKPAQARHQFRDRPTGLRG